MNPDASIDPAWHFELPERCIARYPPEQRGDSRLLHLPLGAPGCVDAAFADLPRWLKPGDVLVLNDSRVLQARLEARRASGGKVELLVLDAGPGEVRALARPARKLRVGETLYLADGSTAQVTGAADGGVVRLLFASNVSEVMDALGELPIPPYLGRGEEPIDRERYQTVVAKKPGSAAAPTAGLHFTTAMLDTIRAAGVTVCTVTLHVGLGTFRPLRPEDLASGRLHVEPYDVGEEVAQAIARARLDGGRVIAVGTTSARTLEAATPLGARVPLAGAGTTDLFIRPPYDFRCVDGLITNFHLPGSSLVMLVAALVGRERLLDAYRHAVHNDYRFFSYGDAMLLL